MKMNLFLNQIYLLNKDPFICVNFLMWYVFLEFQAKNKITKEIVAIKKMSYSGKQAAEVSQLNNTPLIY